MIEVSNLTKRFADVTAVNDISFTVQPGKVTGFLGPNGAGKTTTMRAIAGLDRPSAGTATVNGKRLADHRAPLHEIGLLLNAGHVHPGRSAKNHLLALAATHGIGRTRVREVIELTGLESVANKRAGTFSLGMGQRLGIAGALLGDPATLVMDEPINGLDPDGVLWVRQLLRELAAGGRTVFLSSHLMSEMAMSADHLIVIGRGQLIADSPIAEVLAGEDKSRVLVRTNDAARLTAALAAPSVTVTTVAHDELEIIGIDAGTIARVAADAGVLLHELSTHTASLEDAYMSLTRSSVEFTSGAAVR
ncbi:ABC transporter ATP-binding protein [Marisediminicola antarctica]|uniref:Multidrug ABC transporter ATP-binding protein n=1 Tax=Marisediminicola antarctica TaxID=674079 RepID=A0A7L5AKK7_9MICO|nr:ATP-binding cassette domain-containing protein [Marisediminicola antarctica]QHO70325.1 multidrug ABC transporter ATP-binding protein [Marisediminicola antarctica]